MSTITRQDCASLVSLVNGHLIVRQLQAILKAVGQPTSGLKGALQKRLVAYIEGLYKGQSVARFQQVKELINRPDSATNNHSPASIARTQHMAAAFTSAQMQGIPPAHIHAQPGSMTIAPLRPAVLYRESPFYTILTSLSETARCPVMTSNRHSVSTTVALTQTHVDQLIADPMLRCLVYCAVLDPLTPFNRENDIAFPQQVDLRVNDKQVTGNNLRGLKNKPGTTRPADITQWLTKERGYRNQVTLTYAMTQKEFGFSVHLVKTESVAALVRRLDAGPEITKESVLADMKRKNDDDDLVATSTVMSLKCPISTLRINLPVRGTFCTHNQCFDAESYLQLQEQAPTWNCPTCQRSTPYKQLVVDRYFHDILKNTPNTVESVTIDPDGKWFVKVETSNSPPPPDSDDEDCKEVIDITEAPPSNRRTSYAPVATPTPSVARSTATPNSSRPNGGASNKRPIAQVIDLTLSDDDEPPPRPAKRTNSTAFPTPTSMNGIGNKSNRSTPNAYASHSHSRSPPVWDPNYWFANNGAGGV